MNKPSSPPQSPGRASDANALGKRTFVLDDRVEKIRRAAEPVTLTVIHGVRSSSVPNPDRLGWVSRAVARARRGVIVRRKLIT